MIRVAFDLRRFVRTQFSMSRRAGFGRGKSITRVVVSLFTIY